MIWSEAEDPMDTTLLHSETGDTLLKINPKFYRQAEVELLLGDSSEARKDLGWENGVNFDTLVRRMIENDLKLQ